MMHFQTFCHFAVNYFKSTLIGISTFTVSCLLVTWPASAGTVALSLLHAQTQESIRDTEISFFSLAEDGTQRWFVSATTDAQGRVSVDLSEIENGSQYVARVRLFNNLYSESEIISQPGEFTFEVGKLQVSLLDGTQETYPPKANEEVDILKRSGDDYSFYGKVRSDENGVLLLDLAALGEGAEYAIRAYSSINDVKRISETYSHAGAYQFVVGNPAVTVSLKHADTQTAISDISILAYAIQDDGALVNTGQSAKTNEQGQAQFDFDDIDEGQSYQFRAKISNDYYAHGPTASAYQQYDWHYGNTDITLVGPDAPYAQQKVMARYIDANGRRQFYAYMQTDDNSQLTLDLPDLDQGVSYVFYTQDPDSQTQVASDIIDQAGSYDFVVSENTIQIGLFDYVSGAPIEASGILLYQRNDDGSSTNTGTNFATAADGYAYLDANALEQGSQYFLKTNLLSSYWAESPTFTPAQNFTWHLGNVTVTAIDVETDTDGGEALSDFGFMVTKSSDGSRFVFDGYASTDENGQARLSLPNFDQGMQYRLRANHPDTDDPYFSDIISTVADISFYLGTANDDPPVDDPPVDDPPVYDPPVDDPPDDSDDNAGELVFPGDPSWAGSIEETLDAVITASRTDCVSPCTVVFSADRTRGIEINSHNAWHKLIYRFDFYDMPSGVFELSGKPIEYEVGGPMATRTLTCDLGICQHRVGVRAQDQYGNYDDAYISVQVYAESAKFAAEDTVCVSNSLDIDADWSGYEKACPVGAIQQADVPLPDEYDGRLVLLKRGDLFERNLFTRMGQSNFKIGYFGDSQDARPELIGGLSIGAAGISEPLDNPPTHSTFVSDDDVATYGWTQNVTVEGLRVRNVNYPMSYRHIGVHDMDLDMQDQDSGGGISLHNRGSLCYSWDYLDCANVPFPIGGYISDTIIKGSEIQAIANVQTLNVANMGCSMVVYTGLVGVELGNSGEHNMRDMGWWRSNVSHSYFTGHHKATGRHKLTIRPCGNKHTEEQFTGNFVRDPEGRTRADSELAPSDEDDGYLDTYSHLSRFYLVQNNVFGGETLSESDKMSTSDVNVSTVSERDHYMEDVLITRNLFWDDVVGANGGFTHGRYSSCFDNIYGEGDSGCHVVNAEARNIIEDRTTADTLPDYLPMAEPDAAPEPTVDDGELAAARLGRNIVVSVIHRGFHRTNDDDRDWSGADPTDFNDWHASDSPSNVDAPVISADGKSVTFTRTDADDPAQHYLEFRFGPRYAGSRLSVTMDVTDYQATGSGQHGGSLYVPEQGISGHLVRYPNSAGTWATVLDVDETDVDTYVRVGLGVFSTDRQTQSISISNVQISHLPVDDDLPNEYVDSNSWLTSPAINGASLPYDKVAEYDAEIGLVSFIPGTNVDAPSRNHIMMITDSFGNFISGFTQQIYTGGIDDTSPEYVTSIDTQAGRELEDTADGELMLTMYQAKAHADAMSPGVLAVHLGVNSFILDDGTTAELALTSLQAHIDFAHARDMIAVVTTATPFKLSQYWTEAKQTQVDAYNEAVLALDNGGDVRVIDLNGLLDTDDDDVIDDSYLTGSQDYIHVGGPANEVLYRAYDHMFKAIITSSEP